MILRRAKQAGSLRQAFSPLALSLCGFNSSLFYRVLKIFFETPFLLWVCDSTQPVRKVSSLHALEARSWTTGQLCPGDTRDESCDLN